MSRHLIFIFLSFTLWMATAWADDADPDWRPISDHWYVVTLDGARVGWAHEQVERLAEQERSVSEALFVVRRGDTEVRLSTHTTFLETLEGTPIQMDMLLEAGQDPLQLTWAFREDGILERSKGEERLHPWPSGEWLTPGQQRATWLDALQRGEDHLEYRVMEPEIGLEPYTLEAQRDGSEPFQGPDGLVEASLWRYRDGAQGLGGKLLVDASGLLLLEELETGLGLTTTRLASREEALEPLDEVPEVMSASFIPVDLPEDIPEDATRASLRVCSSTGELDPFPSRGAQRVVREGPDCLLLDVDMQRHSRTRRRDRRSASLLASSSMLEVNDPLLRQLLEQAVPQPTDPAADAEALRSFVRDFIVFSDVSTPLASAGETARTRSGDCTEHAVLLCALLRAAGIRARVASGLIYADAYMGREHVFVWHMWTQAILNGRWVDLDPTLWQPFNPLHVLTSTSDLHSGVLGLSSISDTRLMGTLTIQVLGVR